MLSNTLSAAQHEVLPPDALEELLRRASAREAFRRFAKQAAKGVFRVSYDQIGETAGTIWATLSKRGPQTLAALIEEVNAPERLFFMAVGWLSREGKLEFEPTNGDYRVRLL
jgi:Winged helix-turn-helix domain (DUF2582)